MTCSCVFRKQTTEWNDPVFPSGFPPQVSPLGGNIGQMQLLRRFIVHIRATLEERIRVQNGDSHTFVNQMSNLFLRKWPHCLWPHASLWLWDVFKIQEPAQTNKQPLTWVRFVNYISETELEHGHLFQRTTFFFFFNQRHPLSTNRISTVMAASAACIWFQQMCNCSKWALLHWFVSWQRKNNLGAFTS